MTGGHVAGYRAPATNGDLLSVPWHLGGSPGSRSAFADLGESVPVLAVHAKTRVLAEYVIELHNEELARRAAMMAAAREPTFAEGSAAWLAVYYRWLGSAARLLRLRSLAEGFDILAAGERARESGLRKARLR